MNDEPNPEPEDNRPEHVLFQLGPSAEQIKAWQHYQDMTQASAEAWRHEMRSFLLGMKLDQIKTLHQMLQILSIQQDPADLINFWQGQAAMVIDLNHGLCLACAKNHDEELRLSIEGTPPEGDKNV